MLLAISSHLQELQGAVFSAIPNFRLSFSLVPSHTASILRRSVALTPRLISVCPFLPPLCSVHTVRSSQMPVLGSPPNTDRDDII